MDGNNILEREGMKTSPFKVPEGYFENLSSRVSARVAAGKVSGGKTATLYKWWPLAVAACLAAVVVGIWSLSSPAQSATASAEQEYIIEYLNVSDAQIAEYTTGEQGDSFTQDDIMEYLAYNGASGEYIFDRLTEAE